MIQLIELYTFVVFVAIVVSWLQLPPSNPIAQIAVTLTEPVLAPIRRLVPPVAGLDFSPMILVVALQLLQRLFY
ncbi:MAG: YggT family protein [Acidobacteria bacterium]|nr:YggT family protein [Acidobacteriota bacterium]